MVETKVEGFAAGGSGPLDLSFFIGIEHLQDDQLLEYTLANEDDPRYAVKLGIKLMHKNFIIISHEGNYVIDGWESIKDIVVDKVGGSGYLSLFDYFSPDQAMEIISAVLNEETIHNKFNESLMVHSTIH